MAWSSSSEVTGKSTVKTLFCTWPFWPTSIASTRSSRSRTNSMRWNTAAAGRGVSTTPACRVSEWSIRLASLSTSSSVRLLAEPRWMSSRSLGAGLLQPHQRVHVEAVAPVGGHAARGGVRLLQKAQLLEVRQHVAQGGRGDVELRLAAEVLAADRATRGDVLLHDGAQDFLLASPSSSDIPDHAPDCGVALLLRPIAPQGRLKV